MRPELVEPANFDVWRSMQARRYPALLATLRAAPPNAVVTYKIKRALVIIAVCSGDQEQAAEWMKEMFPQGGPFSPLAAGAIEPLESWCSRRGTPIMTVCPSLSVKIERTSPYTWEYQYETEATTFAALPNALWIPGWDFIIGDDGIVISDSGYMPLDTIHGRRSHSYSSQLGLVAFYQPNSEIMVEDEALYLSGPNQQHFGHWMLDFLPRLKGRDNVGKAIKIVVPDTLHPKQIEILKLFGVRESELMPCSDQHRYRFRSLNVYRPGRYDPPNPDHVAYVRAHLSPHKSKISQGKRIYASRTSVGTRLIRNTDEFNTLLVDEGFIEVEMAHLTIAEQQGLLCDAEIILGAFGTNLLSIYFAPLGCTIIELTDQPENDPTIPHTCNMLGMSHQFLICSVAGKSKGLPIKQPLKKDKDFFVDCAELRRRLHELS